MDKLRRNSFRFGFQFPNGPVCVSRVCVCGNPSQKRSSSAGKHCAYNLINNTKYVNLIRKLAVSKRAPFYPQFKII